MTTLVFKDVGQGDSILIKEEKQDGSTSFVIIDCNTHNGSNPVLDELKAEFSKKPIKIRLFLISHGHDDHYSGANQVLLFCQKNSILIEEFASTLVMVQFDYYRATLDTQEYESITELLQLVTKLDGSIIADVYIVVNNKLNVVFDNGYKLECLYPKTSNYQFLRKQMDDYRTKARKSKPNPNAISTILSIEKENISGLLTSDSLKKSIQVVYNKYFLGKDKLLHLAQAPHHGSKYNYTHKVWDNINRIEQCPVVFSCGQSRHKLPDKEVVDGFKSSNYKIYSTNEVFGIKGATSSKTKSTAVLNAAFGAPSTSSPKMSNSQLNGDQGFELKTNSIAYIP